MFFSLDDDDDNVGNKDDDDLSSNRRRAEGGEGNVDNSVDDEHVDGRVRGPRWADTVDGRRWRLRATVTMMRMSRRADRIPPC